MRTMQIIAAIIVGAGIAASATAPGDVTASWTPATRALKFV